MTGKVLIFGGTGGIGAATARALRANGYDLHLCARNGDKLRSLAGELEASSTVADVEDPLSIAKAVHEAGAALAGLVYAVGTIRLQPLARSSVEDFEKDFRINALGAALAVQAALPALRAHEAPTSVVLFSSIAARQGFPAHSSISMAKAAVEGLVVSLAAELAPKIRVNAIAPSLTRTDLSASITRSPQIAEAIANLHPISRLGEASEVAALASFLIGPNSGWISGQSIAIDGGRSTLRTKG